MFSKKFEPYLHVSHVGGTVAPLKSQVLEHDESSRLRRPVERLESREWHAHPRHATVQLEADPGFLMTSQGMHGA